MVTLLWVTVLAELFDEKSLNMFYIQGHKNSAVVWQEKRYTTIWTFRWYSAGHVPSLRLDVGKDSTENMYNICHTYTHFYWPAHPTPFF